MCLYYNIITYVCTKATLYTIAIDVDSTCIISSLVHLMLSLLAN